jgi:hypothetical protein
MRIGQAYKTSGPRDVLWRTTQFSNYTRPVAPYISIIAYSEFWMHVKWLFVYRCFIFELKEVEMCSSENHIYVCLRIDKERKYVLSLNLELVKIGGYNVPNPCDGTHNSPIFLSCC